MQVLETLACLKTIFFCHLPLDGCVCALDGVKNITNQTTNRQGNSRSRISTDLDKTAYPCDFVKTLQPLLVVIAWCEYIIDALMIFLKQYDNLFLFLGIDIFGVGDPEA